MTELLIGGRVYLRSFENSEVSLLLKWYDDPEIRKLIGEVAPMSREETERFLRELPSDETRRWFAVV